MLDDDVAGNQQALGHFTETDNRDRVVEYIAFPLHGVGGIDVEERGFDPDLVAFPGMQQQAMRLQGNRRRKPVLGDMADIETLHGLPFRYFLAKLGAGYRL